ncbi:MAG: ABC transporter permease [Lacunisphaera sp.]|nr:ABC transporter permease [Lacunisphaera sp.]
MIGVAIKMLMGDTGKYVGMIVGITFAALIMTQQPAILIGLLSRTYSLISDASYPDLWVMDPKVQAVDDVKPLQDTKLLRVRGIEGIRYAVPLYKGMLRARTPDGNFQNCSVIGLDDATLIGGPGNMVAGKLEDLRRADAVIIDVDGANKYLAQKLPDGTRVPLKVGDTLEINDKRAVLVGIARTTPTFGSLPLIYTTYKRTLAFAPQERLKLSFILAGLKPGVEAAPVIASINQYTGLTAYTAEQFKKVSVQYTIDNSGIVVSFGIVVMLGFIVGAATSGQVFYNFTQDNIKQFAALKAMGTSNGMLVKMVLAQAALVGISGWGIGIGLVSLLGLSIGPNGDFPFMMPWQVVALSGSGIVLIVIFAALLSIRKVVTLEPGVVFK